MKKVGQFFFIFVPLLLSIALEFLAQFFTLGLSATLELSWYTASGKAGFAAIFDDLFALWTNTDFNGYLMASYALMSVGIFGLWYYARYDGNYRPNPRATFHPLTFLGIVILVPGMQFLSNYIVTFVSAIFPHWLDVYEDLIETAGLDDTVTFGLFLYSVIIGPISEELIFRGVTLRQAKKVFPFWAANLMQAFLFGVFHMNMIQGIYAFALGLILGYICEKGNSIYHSILLHMLFNFWATAISQFIYINDTVASFIGWLLFSIIATAAGLLIFWQGTKKIAARSVPTGSDISSEIQ